MGRQSIGHCAEATGGTEASELRAFFATGATRSIEWRRSQLQGIKSMILENIEAWSLACQKSGKPAFEAEMAEVLPLKLDVAATLKNFVSWGAVQHAPTPLALMPASSYVEKLPLGATLIIGPFNYPLSLTIGPLMGAFAAGCPAVVKPPEACPDVCQLMAELMPKYLDPRGYRLVLGGVEVSEALLAQRWDNILFTGSARVGKKVAAAAAVHLTPLTLELGGKSPVILDKSAGDLGVVADKLVWGRFVNAGQTCVAPEYVLAPLDMVDDLCKALAKAIETTYGKDPRRSTSYARMISPEAVQRVRGLLVGHGGTIVCGGEADHEEKYVSPTVIKNPTPDCALMQDEVFGPVLCVIGVASLHEAIAFASSRPTPLALYVFSNDKAATTRVLAECRSGGAMVNDVVIHFASPHVPFGGLGESGNGRMHGRWYFEACSAQRGVITKGTDIFTRLLDVEAVCRRAPYAEWKLTLVHMLAKDWIPALPPRYGYLSLLIALIVPVFFFFGRLQ